MRSLGGLVAGVVSLLALPLVTLTLVAGPASASCAEPSADLLDGSDVAFSGVVTELVRSGGRDIVTVRVDRAFKGDVLRRVDVVNQADVADVIRAGTGDEVVVFGTLDGEVTSDGCRTIVATAENYRQVLSDLGEGTAPAPGYLKADRTRFGLSYEQFSAGRALLGVLGLGFAGFFAFRFWRARRRTT